MTCANIFGHVLNNPMYVECSTSEKGVCAINTQ